MTAAFADAAREVVGDISLASGASFGMALPNVFVSRSLPPAARDQLCASASALSAELAPASIACATSPAPHATVLAPRATSFGNSTTPTHDPSRAGIWQAAFWTSIFLLLVFLAATCALCCMSIPNDPILYRNSLSKLD